MHRLGRQPRREHRHQVGAVHAVGRVPAVQVGDLNGRDLAAVVAQVA